MGQVQLGKRFAEDEINNLAALLKTLTDEHKGTPLTRLTPQDLH